MLIAVSTMTTARRPASVSADPATRPASAPCGEGRRCCLPPSGLRRGGAEDDGDRGRDRCVTDDEVGRPDDEESCERSAQPGGERAVPAQRVSQRSHCGAEDEQKREHGGQATLGQQLEVGRVRVGF